MCSIEDKIQSLIGKKIQYNGEVLTVKSGKSISSKVVLQTDKFPINFHKHSLEFKNLKEFEEMKDPISIQEVTHKPIESSTPELTTKNLEPEMNTEITTPEQEQSRVLPQAQSQNQVSIANALQGSAELRETLLATLNKLTSASSESEKKSAIEIAKAVSLVGKEVNELLKTGVRAVEVIKKI